MKITKKELLNKIKKLSSLDILSLFAIFFVTASTYFFLSRKTEYLDITLRLLNQDVPEYKIDSIPTKAWYIEQIKVGKTQKNAFGDKLAEIIEVYSYPSGDVYNDVYLTIRLKVTRNKITKQYVYEGNPLLIHDVRSFKIQDLIVNGEIINIGDNIDQNKSIEVTFELDPQRLSFDLQNNSQSQIKGVDNFIANSIRKGMTIKDSEGQNTVEIIDVDKKPGKILFVTADGIKEVTDPNRTQVIIKTKLIANIINGQYYFQKENPLLIDGKIYLTFDWITVHGKIIDIKMN